MWHFLVFIVSLGRYLLHLIGIIKVSEVYSAALGIYIFWILARILMFVIPYARGGMHTFISKIPSWTFITAKCIVAATILLFVIPMCMGFLADMLVISAIRVPFNKTPLYYSSMVSYFTIVLGVI